MAETLFWTGRYVERADDTARLVDVYVHRLLGDPGVQRAGSGADCGPLFGILGVEPGPETEPDVGAALFRLAYDMKSPSAIAGAVLAARAGARGIREVISSEMWECLNVAGHGLTSQRRAADRLGPHVFLRFIRERAALFFGLADSTMSHDDAWRFLVLGRSLERADMTARLEHADTGQLTDQLAELLGSLQQACVEACEAITGRYFQYEAPVAWERDG